MRSNFNAFSWTANARQYGGEFGVTVSKVPEVGDIAVWQAGCDGTTPIPSTGQCTKSPVTGNYEGCGHVAYVVSVDRQNRTFRVVEAAWNRSNPDVKINESCMDFIHTPYQSGPNEPIFQKAAPVQPPVILQNTDTVLLVDTSTSMKENDIGGMQKMAAAQKAAGNLLEVISSEQQAAGATFNHQIGLVSFSSSASTIQDMTTDTMGVKESVEQLFPSGNTAMGAGLQEAIGLLNASSASNRMIVLLSDGVPTVGLEEDFCWFFCNPTEEDIQKYKQEVLEVAREAKSKNICVHTVGFGDPSAIHNSNAYIDEDFLRQVAANSGCGRYYGAQESIQLANAFVELRHNAMGALLLQRSGQISQGETLALGTASVPANQSQLMLTVNWPGSQIIPQLVDPSGRTINAGYPGAVINQGDTLATILVDRPAAGDWRLSVFGQNVPEGVTSYNALISTRIGQTSQQGEETHWLWVGLAVIFIAIGLIASSSRQRVTAQPNPRAPFRPATQTPAAQPVPHQNAYLAGTGGGLAGKRVQLGRGGLLGRGPNCQLVIPDPSVSREHARLIFTQGRWFIQDLGSRSGTFINNQRVQNAPLKDGVSIRLGRSTFTFHER
jgi:uncharacterized protein YegL